MDPALHDALERSLGTGFRLDRELGGGGMSRVFLAHDLSLDRDVVVKVLPADLSAAASADRFRREIQLVAKLQHPHVVPILSAGDAEGTLYYVMPFLAGESLRARMVREGPLPVTESVRILREALDALAFAHAHGVIHRDIKPENILLSASHAVVADFGVSKALQDSGALTTAGMTVGTPMYMAPEQAAADPTTDHRADLYAVAIVAYEMLTGAPPFTGTPTQVIKQHFSDKPAPLKQRRSDIPDALAEVMMRALEKEPARRPQSATEMISVLDGVLTPAGGESAAMPATRIAPARRSRTPMIAASVVTVLAAVGVWAALRPDVIASAQSMAITPFSVADGDTALIRLGQNLVTTMSANLDGVGDIRVADPMAVLSHAKSSAGLLSQEQAFGIARALGVRSAVVGTLVRAGSAVRADLALYDLDGVAEPVVRLSRTLPIDSVSALTDSLTWGLLREVWAKGGAPTVNASSIDTRSPVALREFLEAERLFGRGDTRGAAAGYLRAIAADTTFIFAHIRYVIAQGWTTQVFDPAVLARMKRDGGRLPERERMFFYAYDSSATATDRIRRLRAVNARFPDYPPAILGEGDLIIHWAPNIGTEIGDAIAPFTRLVRLMPTDLPAAEHLAYACLAAGDLRCAEAAAAHHDSLVHADPSPVASQILYQRRFSLALHGTAKGWADSMAGVIERSPALPPSLLSAPAIYAATYVQRPAVLSAEEDLFARLAAHGGPVTDSMGMSRWGRRATRGEAVAFDSADATIARMTDAAQRANFARVGHHWRAIMELQGLFELTVASAQQELADAATLGPGPVRREGLWIAGANALWRGDSAGYRLQLAALAADTTDEERYALRSLRAVRLGREGRRAAAAESLLVLERAHADDFGIVSFLSVMDRLLGAEWLIEAGRLLPADSLLRYTRTYATPAVTINATAATFPAAQLLRSRIAEGLGQRDRAIEFARIFLLTFDRAGPVASGRITEARDRITRLGGSLEGLPPAR